MILASNAFGDSTSDFRTSIALFIRKLCISIVDPDNNEKNSTFCGV